MPSRSRPARTLVGSAARSWVGWFACYAAGVHAHRVERRSANLEQDAAGHNRTIVFEEGFQGQSLGAGWCGSTPAVVCRHTSVVEGGPDGRSASRSLRVAYEPSDVGSPRLTLNRQLSSPLISGTVSFDVFFEDDFEFVRGGKLGAGFCGGSCTSGCAEVAPNGWSARPMWRTDGQLSLYLYDQDRCGGGSGRCCGSDVYAEVQGRRFQFAKGRWYALALSVTLNSPASLGNGRAELRVDGELVAQKNGVRFRATDDTLIETFMFSTFYGGNDPSWAPSRTVHARFHDFKVVGVVPALCEESCAADPQPWAEKCDQRGGACASCPECRPVVKKPHEESKPDSGGEPVRAEKQCLSWCAANEQAWPQKCAWSSGKCGACAECGRQCLHWCAANAQSWEAKCAWTSGKCGACPQCAQAR